MLMTYDLIWLLIHMLNKMCFPLILILNTSVSPILFHKNRSKNRYKNEVIW